MGDIFSSVGKALYEANSGPTDEPARAPETPAPPRPMEAAPQPQTAGDYIMQLLSTIGQNKPDPRASYLGVLGLL